MNAKLDVLEGEWAEVEKSNDTSPDAIIAHLEMVKVREIFIKKIFFWHLSMTWLDLLIR